MKSDIFYSSYLVGKDIDPLVIQVGRIGKIYFQPSNNEHCAGLASSLLNRRAPYWNLQTCLALWLATVGE